MPWIYRKNVFVKPAAVPDKLSRKSDQTLLKSHLAATRPATPTSASISQMASTQLFIMSDTALLPMPLSHAPHPGINIAGYAKDAARRTGTVRDTIIVGGGLCGLALAQSLRGRDFTLYEARERMGGRIFSERCRRNNLAVDLGPTWFWPDTQPRVTQMISGLGLDTFAQRAPLPRREMFCCARRSIFRRW